MMTPDKPYFVYILWSTFRNCFYIGVTEDVDNRLKDHNSGVSKWTKGKGPWTIVRQKEFPTLSNARKFELLLKRKKDGNKFYELTGLEKTDFLSLNFLSSKKLWFLVVVHCPKFRFCRIPKNASILKPRKM